MNFNRVLAMFMDFMIIILLAYIPYLVAFLLRGNTITNFDMNILLATTGLLILLKDIPFKNASIGKRVMCLEVLNKDLKKPGKPLLILRNVPLLFWPLEALIYIIAHKRLGDIICGTVVTINKTEYDELKKEISARIQGNQESKEVSNKDN